MSWQSPSAMAGIGGMPGAMDGSNGPQGTEYTLQGEHRSILILGMPLTDNRF